MKKFAAVIAVMALCSAPVMAAEQGGFSGPSATQSQAGGFQGPNGSVTTVESAKSLRDDTWVTLRGNIVERISDDLYVFKDASGTINVDIDHKRWNGVTVTPKDTVEIQGEVDKDWNSVEIDVKQIRKVKSLPGELRIIPRLNSEYYNFNLEKPPFNDVRVRRALYLTVDRQLIAQKVLGLRTPATTLTPPEVKGFSATTFDELQKPMSERVAMAKVLLKQAGYDASHPLRFELFYNKYDLHENTAIALSSEWKKWLGAQVTLRTMEWKTYLDARRAGDFMLSRQSWDATYNDASSFLNTLKSDSEENVGHWKNAQYDALLNQATQITDATKRNALYQQAEVIINQQAPLIPIYYQPLIKLLKPYVGGFPLHNPQDYVYSKELYIKAH